MKTRLLLVCAFVALLAAGCGKGPATTSRPDSESTATPSTTSTGTPSTTSTSSTQSTGH